VTGLVSRDLITLTARADLGTRPTLSVGLSATNMTACPCMQAYALDDLIAHFAENEAMLEAGSENSGLAARDAARASVPIATHSQKGRVRITVTFPIGAPGDAGPENLPTITDLYGVLQAGTTLTSELLKRPDEYDMVRRVHKRAQFVEDVTREIAATAATRMPALPPEALIKVDASSFESIHGHDIEATLTTTLDGLLARA
jgi:GTP cyclohydrolase FolE2